MIQNKGIQFITESAQSFSNNSAKGCRIRCPGGFRKMGLVALIFFAILFSAHSVRADISYTISKSNNAPSPVPSGQPFTYTITYSWSGGAPGTIYILDNVPASLDVISALPGSPVSSISGNTVTFALSGLTLPSGSGTVQINAKFKPGVTCEGTVACNNASLTDNLDGGEFLKTPDDCVTSSKPANKWVFEKEWIAGCAVDDEVIFRIKIMNPAGSDIGGLNLTSVNIQDLLPPGAIVNSVTGNWSGISGTTLTGGPSVLTVSPWTVWYIAYVKVTFPSPTFVSGQLVSNRAQLSFTTPCNNEPMVWTDEAEVTLCDGINSGSLGKYLSLGLYFPSNPSWYPVFTPGCCGTYRIYYTNNGTLAQSNFVMEDEIPAELELNTIRTNVPSGNTPVTVDVYCWTGTTCSAVPCTTVVYSSPGIQTMTGLPANICKVKWSYSNTINVSQYVYNYLDVCVRSNRYTDGSPVNVGDNIVNTAYASANGFGPISIDHVKAVDNSQPKVIATKLFIGDCTPGCTVTPSGPFQPGDIVRFRMAVANIGSMDATVCAINDMLPSGLSYVGNETYYFGTFNWMTNIYNPPCCSLTTTIPVDIGGSITTPTLGATNLTWSFPVLPGRCDGQVDYFIIDFDVQISDDPPAAPGQYVNTFDISASNVSAVNSNNAYLTVNAVAQLQAIKEARTSPSGAWGPSASVPAGSAADFKLTVQNTGNMDLTDICLLDIMPWVGDIKVLPAYTTRGSMFNLPYNPANGPIGITPGGFLTTYNNSGLIPSQNPTRSTECGGFCGVSDPAGATTGSFTSTGTNTYSFKVNAGSGVTLAPGSTLDVIVPVKTPTQGAQIGDHACNSFAIQAIPDGMPGICLSAESNTACIEIAEEPKPCFEIFEQRIECKGLADGQWEYALNFTITNMSGVDGAISMSATPGSMGTVTPVSIPSGTPTNVSATYYTSSAGSGSVCFAIVLYDKEQRELCDTTFCLDYKPCPDPCPCPFDIRIDTKKPVQGKGDKVFIGNAFTVSGANILQVRANIVSVSVSQYCKNWTWNTMYNHGATIDTTNWNPTMAEGYGSSELAWDDLDCPTLTGQGINLNLNIPSAPPKHCYQRIKVCIRYSFTDCDCNTCDTLVCYEFTRKWVPKIIIWNPGGDNNFIQMKMTSEKMGKLIINNPMEDEETMGMTIKSIILSSPDGVMISSMKNTDGSFENGISMDDMMKSMGELMPGESAEFDIEFVNKQALKKWLNTVQIDYVIPDFEESLSINGDFMLRTPGALNGDKLSNNKEADALKNAKTYALVFENANMSDDNISGLTLSVNNGEILAVGPGASDQSVSLNGFELSDGNMAFLQLSPNEDGTSMKGLEPGSEIGPIYLTISSSDGNAIMLDYETRAEDGAIITSGELELTPVTGVEDDDISTEIRTVMLSNAVPNPANSSVKIRFDLGKGESFVKLSVRDSKGALVALPLPGNAMSAGAHEIDFDASMLPSGIYYYTIQTNTETQTKKISVVK